MTVVTPNLFELLGVTPMLGRGFAPNEAGPGRPNLIVLTHELWNRLGADPAIVGAQVRLQGNAYTVIGVLPPTFSFVRNEALRAPQRIDAFIAFGLRSCDPANPTAGTSRRSSARGVARRRRPWRPRSTPPAGRSTRATSTVAA